MFPEADEQAVSVRGDDPHLHVFLLVSGSDLAQSDRVEGKGVGGRVGGVARFSLYMAPLSHIAELADGRQELQALAAKDGGTGNVGEKRI